MIASKKGHKDVEELLIKHGAKGHNHGAKGHNHGAKGHNHDTFYCCIILIIIFILIYKLIEWVYYCACDYIVNSWF
jgi:hypothetical protein